MENWYFLHPPFCFFILTSKQTLKDKLEGAIWMEVVGAYLYMI